MVLDFPRFFVGRMFLSYLPLCHYFLIFHTIGLNDLVYPSPAPHFKTFNLFMLYFPKCTSSITVQSYVSNVTRKYEYIYLMGDLLLQLEQNSLFCLYVYEFK